MSYTPPESSAVLYAEHTWLAGAVIAGAGYGVVLALTWLWMRPATDETSSSSSTLSSCSRSGTLFIGSNSKFTQLAFIENRDFPGGPSQYEQEMFSISVDEISNVAFVLSNWLADSLLVWRCAIIYRDTGSLPWIVVAITCLMQLTSYVLGTFFLVQISSPASSPYFNSSTRVNWTLPYFFLSLAINIVVTIVIVVRLLIYRRRMIQLLGPGHESDTTTVVAVLIESAAVHSTFSLLFLIPFAIDSPVSNAFLQVVGETQLIAPLLIIYREAQGKGWISSTSTAGSSTVPSDNAIRFARFSDIHFASVERTSDGTVRTVDKKRDDIQEVSRKDEREEIELP
ncbi:hypothetical protein BU15DRAFT_65517 [Melanogaster broomeanus]|nr:hypothetical protein BU15DRAFT_65517 [Melanogaster broomeanus]